MSYQSFMWSIGTTSFRTKELNKKIEHQLQLLSRFQKSMGHNYIWDSMTQAKFYDFLKEHGFLTGNAQRPDKDARQKTSGLVDLGFVDKENRILTESGKKLLSITEQNNFKDNNILGIDKDSLLYLQQLLKTSIQVNNQSIRPFIVLVSMLNNLEYLTKTEIKLLALCIDSKSYDIILRSIKTARTNNKTEQSLINSTIKNIIMSMDNYIDKFNIFVKSPIISEKTMLEIGMSRKGGGYDKKYYYVYETLKATVLQDDLSKISILLDGIKKLPSNVQKYWKNIIFTEESLATRKTSEYRLKISFDSEQQLRKFFFIHMHTFKTLATLDDYADLNLRYLRLSDILYTQGLKIQFTTLANIFFTKNIQQIETQMFIPTTSENLHSVTKIYEIFTNIFDSDAEIFEAFSARYKVDIDNIEDAKNIQDKERIKQFDTLIQNQFSIENLITILYLFTQRQQNNKDSIDAKIKKLVTDEADAPTIFEYILGITWYKISENKGNILNALNLSLNADMLPKSHATGGKADIIYNYEATNNYPEHTVLIEATLSHGTNQRNMEMEPVSRHLGNYLLNHDNKQAYCLFISNILQYNIISDFRGKKDSFYYSNDGQNKIESMQITPLELKEVIHIVKNHITYKQLYPIFKDSYNDNTQDPIVWRENTLQQKILNLCN